MYKKSYQKIIIIVLLLSLALTVACESADTQGDSEQKSSNQERIVIAGGPTGGMFDVVAATSTEILKNEMGINADVIPGGSGPNLILLDNNTADVGITYGTNLADAWIGKDPSPDKPLKSIEALFGLFPIGFQFWANENIDIADLEDLTKYRVCPGAPGQAPWTTFWNLMDVAGIEEEDFKKNGGAVVSLTWSEAGDALRDGKIDVMGWLALYPHPAIVDVGLTRNLKMVNLSKDIVDKYLSEYQGVIEINIPKGTYSFQKEDVNTIGTVGLYAVKNDMDEELAYEITKTLLENKETLVTAYANLKYINKDTMGRNLVVQIHPGAQRYLNEIGATMDEPKLVP